MIIGLLHPGQMGAAVGARLTGHGHTVLWCTQARSAATRRRALDGGLKTVDQLSDLLADAELVLSICPAAAAEEVAECLESRSWQDLAGRRIDATGVEID